MERQGTDGGRHIQRLQLTGTEKMNERERKRQTEREKVSESKKKKQTQNLHFLPEVVITLPQIACRVEEQQHPF